MILDKITDRSKALEVASTSVTPVKITFKALFSKDLILDLTNDRGPRASKCLQSFYCQQVISASKADNRLKRTCGCQRNTQLDPLCNMK